MSYPKKMSAPDLTRKETSDDMAVSPAGATAPDHDKPNSKRTLSKTVSPQHGATESASDEKNRTPTTCEKQATRESDVVALCGCDPNATPKQIIKTLIEKIDAMPLLSTRLRTSTMDYTMKISAEAMDNLTAHISIFMQAVLDKMQQQDVEELKILMPIGTYLLAQVTSLAACARAAASAAASTAASTADPPTTVTTAVATTLPTALTASAIDVSFMASAAAPTAADAAALAAALATSEPAVVDAAALAAAHATSEPAAADAAALATSEPAATVSSPLAAALATSEPVMACVNPTASMIIFWVRRAHAPFNLGNSSWATQILIALRSPAAASAASAFAFAAIASAAIASFAAIAAFAALETTFAAFAAFAAFALEVAQDLKARYTLKLAHTSSASSFRSLFASAEPEDIWFSMTLILPICTGFGVFGFVFVFVLSFPCVVVSYLHAFFTSPTGLRYCILN